MLRFSSFFTAILLSMGLESVELSSRFDIFSGYRNLDYHQDATFFLPDNSISDDIVLDKIEDRITNVHIGLIGIDAQLAYDNFYFNGFANWGWQGGTATFKQQNTSYPIGDFPIRTTSKRKVSNTQVSDYQATIGYLFDFDNWALSLVTGYAYSQQNISRYKTDWQGGLVGFNLFYPYCMWNFATGYQYQFVSLCFRHNHSELPLRGHTNGGSNLAYLAASYTLCNGWDLSFAAEYQDWSTGNYKTKVRDDSFPSECIGITSKTKVSTYSLLGSLGYTF